MKNIQVIDGARNCTYSIFAATDTAFLILFPDGSDVAFPDEIIERLGERRASAMLTKLWKRPVDKKTARGIHGTLFYGLDFKKALYPTRRESGMAATALNSAQRKSVRE